MSYVLDALRRADAERQRGALPGLQSQPQALSPDTAPRSSAAWAVMGAAAVALLAIGAGIGWWALRPAPRAPQASGVAQAPLASGEPQAPQAPQASGAARTPQASGAPQTPQASGAPRAPVAASPDGSAALPPAVATAPPPAAAASAAPPSATPAPEPLPLPAPPVAKAAEPTYLQKSAASATPATAVPRAAPTPTQAASAAAPAAAAAPAPSAPERLPTLADLPDALRRQIPALQPGGAMDSPQPAARLLIVNGQPFREGDQLAPGLTLQQIKLRSAVFDFRGTRFELRY